MGGEGGGEGGGEEKKKPHVVKNTSRPIIFIYRHRINAHADFAHCHTHIISQLTDGVSSLKSAEHIYRLKRIISCRPFRLPPLSGPLWQPATIDPIMDL